MVGENQVYALFLGIHRLASGSWRYVRRDRVRLPDGGEAVREYIVHPGAVLWFPRSTMADSSSCASSDIRRIVRSWNFRPASSTPAKPALATA